MNAARSSVPQARIDRPVDKRRASHALPLLVVQQALSFRQARASSLLLSIRLPPRSFARVGQSLLARGLLSDHRRFKHPHERNGVSRCYFTVQINEIAQMKKTRDAVPVALLSRLGEIDIARLV
jgi:hypothetical protein